MRDSITLRAGQGERLGRFDAQKEYTIQSQRRTIATQRNKYCYLTLVPVLMMAHAAAAWQQELTVFGLPHSALGDATLDVRPNGNLIVSNLGSSGNAGVEIATGDSKGLQTTLLDVEWTDRGSYLETVHRGIVGGREQVVGVTRYESNGTDIVMTADFSSIGSNSNTVEVYLDGELVARETGVVGPVATIEGEGDNPIIKIIIKIIIIIILALLPSCGIMLADPTIIVIGAGLWSGIGDEIRVIPENPTVEVSYLTRDTHLAADIPELIINDEALRMFESPHRALGQATFEAAEGNLTVSNIGSSGEDGVDIDLAQAGGFDASLDPIDLSTSGLALQVEALGSFDSRPGTLLGTAGIRNNGRTLRVTADYGAIGSTLVQVEVYNGGTFVGSAMVPGGRPEGVAVVAGAPQISGCGKIPGWRLPPFLPCFWFLLDQVASVTPIGGEPLVGDEIRLLAANANGTIDSLSGFSITGVDLGSLTITDETVLPLFAPGDVNCDGSFNGGDIDPFFLALGDPAAYAAQFPSCDILNGDMNRDGRLDGGDIDPFFACLGSGGCW